jgi:hypothetical protein
MNTHTTQRGDLEDSSAKLVLSTRPKDFGLDLGKTTPGQKPPFCHRGEWLSETVDTGPLCGPMAMCLLYSCTGVETVELINRGREGREKPVRI